MPLATIASAVSRMSWSLTLQPNLFQLFQPSCGAFASPSNFWAIAGNAQRASSASAENLINRILNSLVFGQDQDGATVRASASSSSVSRVQGSKGFTQPLRAATV